MTNPKQSSGWSGPVRFVAAQGPRCRVALSIIMIVAASAKLMSPVEGPEGLLHPGLAVAELLAAAGLLADRQAQLSLMFVVALAVGGSVQSLITKTDCSCFGSHVSLSWKAHAMLCSLMGMMVAVAWPAAPGRKLDDITRQQA